MPEEQEVIESQPPRFKDELAPPAQAPVSNLDLEDILQIPLRVSATLGHAVMRVREILELKEGSIVTLDKLAGEMTDISVNDLLLARGEVVVIGNALHVRLAEIVGVSERLDRGHG